MEKKRGEHQGLFLFSAVKINSNCSYMLFSALSSVCGCLA